MDEINICMAFNDKNGSYIKIFYTSILSILDNTKHTIHFHILHDETMDEHVKNLIIELITLHNSKVYFYDMTSYNFQASESVLKRYSIASLYRLKIPEIISDKIQKILYLDGDIIVSLDINELWEQNIQDYAVGAVLDSEISRKVFFNKYNFKKYMKYEKYFNSGVLLLNLDKIRNYYSDLFIKATTILDEHNDWDAADQNPLNIIFQNDCLFLDNKFNHIASDYSNVSIPELQGYIWHYAGIHKPWLFKNNFADLLYWHYFTKTPFGDNEEKLFLELWNVKDDSLDNLVRQYPIGSRKRFLIGVLRRFFNKV